MEKDLVLPCDKPCTIKKWFVKKGSIIRQGTVLCSYVAEGSNDVQKLRSCTFGTVAEILIFPNSAVIPKAGVLKIRGCSHPIVMKDMCAECGEDLRQEFGVAGDRRGQSSASVAMVHSIPELIVSTEQAVELGKADEQRLLSTRKLVLLVDLDETLLHTTNDNVPPNLKDVYHFQLQHGPSTLWYHTKFRPGTKAFLEKMSKMYELHICTFGARMYAHTMASYLDPEKKYFSHRILSRDECFDSRSKQANLRALFPCGDEMVCIIDDREEVWKFTPNMIKVKPYHFFEHTADINAPPGMERTDKDTDKTLKRSIKIHRIPKKKNSSASETSNQADKDKEALKGDSQSVNESKCSEKDKHSKAAETGDGVKEESNVNKGKERNPREKCEEKCVQSEDKECESLHKTGKKNTEDQEDMGDSSTNIKATDQAAVDLQSGDTVECINEFVGEGLEVSSSDSESEQTVAKAEKETDASSDKRPTKDTGDASSKEDGDKQSPSAKGSDRRAGDVIKDGAEGNTEDDFDEILEWEDTDDYLLYLEEILTQVHKIFFDMHDELKQKSSEIKEEDKPNLKKIVPYAKKKILLGKNIVFSGVVPTNMVLERSRPYLVAKSLGANVQRDIELKGHKRTTHVVAARLGTVKVKEALRHKDIAVVTPDWLWLCDWRWEHVDERLFLLDTKATFTPGEQQASQGSSLKRKAQGGPENEENDVTSSKRQKSDLENDVINDVIVSSSSNNDDALNSDSVNREFSGTRRFSDSINPLALLSQDDIDSLNREVEEMSDESESEEGEKDGQKERDGGDGREREQEDDGDDNLGSDDATLRQQVLGVSSPESSSDESMSGDYPQGWRPKSNSPSYEDNSHLLEIDDPHEAKTALFKAARSSDHFLFEEDTNSVTEESDDSQDSGDEEFAAAIERGLFS